MNDKFVAGLMTAIVVALVCSVCILGPAVIASAFAGIAAWFAGIEEFVTVGLVVVAGLIAFGFARSRRRQRAFVSPSE